MTDEYTPTTGKVRHAYVNWFGSSAERVRLLMGSAFDRWLAAHDAEIRAERDSLARLHEVVRLEQRVAELQALSARWAEVVNAPSFEAAVEADARAYHDSACAYQQERDSLARLHEVATERTVQLAAVIEKARALVPKWEDERHGYPPTGEGRAASAAVNLCGQEVFEALSADTGAALREVRADAWDEGCLAAWHHGEEAENPYRETGGDSEERALSGWKPGDPCGSCGSTKTGWNPADGGTCNGCGRTDADE